jgi:hypothetical protein
VFPTPFEFETHGKISAKSNTINSVRTSVSSAASAPSLITTGGGRSASFTFVHLGRNGGSMTFSTSSIADKQAWVDAMETQRNLLMDSSKFFELQLLNDNFFKISNRVNCSVSYAGMLLVGTDDGLYVGTEHNVDTPLSSRLFRKVIHEENILQVDILPDYDMLIFLAGEI